MNSKIGTNFYTWHRLAAGRPVLWPGLGADAVEQRPGAGTGAAAGRPAGARSG